MITQSKDVLGKTSLSANADFDGDVINTMALPLEELVSFYEGFSPTNMLISRTDENIRFEPSALENLSIAIFSDR